MPLLQVAPALSSDPKLQVIDCGCGRGVHCTGQLRYRLQLGPKDYWHYLIAQEGKLARRLIWRFGHSD